MKNKDWFFIEDDRLYNFRAAGVLLVDKKLLIQKGVNDNEYALPGGQVAWGETGAQALIREFKEETGADVDVKRMIWLEEIFWKWGKRQAHTVCHYYLVNLKKPSQIPANGHFTSLETDASRLHFEWVDIDNLDKFDVYPTFIKEKITCLPQGIEHFVSRYHQ